MKESIHQGVRRISLPLPYGMLTAAPRKAGKEEEWFGKKAKGKLPLVESPE